MRCLCVVLLLLSCSISSSAEEGLYSIFREYRTALTNPEKMSAVAQYISRDALDEYINEIYWASSDSQRAINVEGMVRLMDFGDLAERVVGSEEMKLAPKRRMLVIYLRNKDRQPSVMRIQYVFENGKWLIHSFEYDTSKRAQHQKDKLIEVFPKGVPRFESQVMKDEALLIEKLRSPDVNGQ